MRENGHVLPLIDTQVTFPSGGLTVESPVLAVTEVPIAGEDAGSLVGVVTAISPFHPVDPAWPDQGPDRGTVVIDGAEVEVVDVVLGATQGSNLLTATNIPVRRGEPGWAFVVVHVLAADAPVPTVGKVVELRVDPAVRDALCFGHTACHVASLALNAALEDRWRKPVPVDGFGHPNFDRLALASSRIHPDGATDRYRLGKSLRKKGFDGAGLDVSEVAGEANRILARWVDVGADISIETAGSGLTDLRTWVCRLPEGIERIPCGGTHLTSLARVAAIEVTLVLDEAELTMETRVTRR